MIMWRDLSTVLAFAIRYRVFPTGRALSQPRLSVVDGLATKQTSRISGCTPTSKATGEIDSQNPFIPYHSPICQAADNLLMFGIAAMGFAAGVLALARSAGVFG